jgi:hypothetical protein
MVHRHFVIATLACIVLVTNCAHGASSLDRWRYTMPKDGLPARQYVGTWLDVSRSTTTDTVLLVLRADATGHVAHRGAGPHQRALDNWQGWWTVATSPRDRSAGDSLCLAKLFEREWRTRCVGVTGVDTSGDRVTFTVRTVADTLPRRFERRFEPMGQSRGLAIGR